MGKKSSNDRGSKNINSYFIWRRFTERDTAAKLRCLKTAGHNTIVKFNADGTFHDRKRSGVYGRLRQGRPLIETHSNALAKELRQESLY